MTLQSEESVAEEKRRRTGNSASVAGNNSFVTSYSKHHDFCVGYLQTHISLPVPLYVTPSFDTDLVALKWRLHFEFVTSVKPIDWSTGPDWKPPGEVDIETMVWDLPISIYPTAPAHVSKAISIQREATINLWLSSDLTRFPVSVSVTVKIKSIIIFTFTRNGRSFNLTSF